MKKLFFLPVLLFMSTGFSQQTSSDIDAIVTAYDQAISEGEELDEPLNNITVKCPLTLPGIGPVNHDAVIYFDNTYSYNEDGSVNRPKIRKVHFEINAGSYQVRMNYYFAENTDFIYYDEVELSSDSDCIQSRYYFQQGRCIKVAETPVPTEECSPADGKPSSASERTELTQVDYAKGAKLEAESIKFRRILDLYHELMLER